MSLITKIIVLIVAALFLLLGVVGTFQPLQFAAQLGFELPKDVAVGNFRAMVGAPYLAMALVCGFAVARNAPALLFPIGMIEALMVLSRGIAALNGEFDPTVIAPTLLEVGLSTILISISWRGVMSR
ncbi:MAG: hypothetical protein AAFV37_10830 [Pseudomonadota bacterium]